MPAFAIYAEHDRRNALATVEAPDEIDALSEYAIGRGYSDPRIAEDGPDYFEKWFDGTQAMTFENLELIAVPADVD